MEELADEMLPQRSLVCAIIGQAVRDCCKPETREGLEALRWLGSREVEEWCLAWEIDIQRVKRVINNGVVRYNRVI